MKRIVFLGGIILLSVAAAQAQSRSRVRVNVRDSIVSAVLIAPSAGAYVPLGDFAERASAAFQIGGSIWYKFNTNWVVGGSAHYLFSESARQPRLMDNLSPIISGDGSLTNISVGLAGLTAFANFGRLIPLGRKPNRNSGILAMVGVGYMQHQIQIRTTGLTPQAQGIYLKGYDRFSNGVALNQFVGYMFLGNDRAVNFYVGVDVTEGFTVNRRGFNYDTGTTDTGSRIDVMLGVRAGWIFSIYPNGSKKGKVHEYEYF